METNNEHPEIREEEIEPGVTLITANAKGMAEIFRRAYGLKDDPSPETVNDVSVHFTGDAGGGRIIGTLTVLVNLETIQIVDDNEGQQVVLDLDEARGLLALLKAVVPAEPQGAAPDGD